METTNIYLTFPLKRGVIEFPVVVLYGSRVVGKDSITSVWKELNNFVEKVETDVVWRKRREGEVLALASGVSSKSLDELLVSEEEYVVLYGEEDVLYAVPKRSFNKDKIPVLHIVGPRGLEQLERERTLHYKLNILLTLNLVDKEKINKDIEARVIDRLIAGNELPKDFSLGSATDEQLERIVNRIDYTRDRLAYFEGQKFVCYSAIFDNSSISTDDVRLLLYEKVRNKDVITQDIALRINELYNRFIQKLQQGVLYTDINFAEIHNDFVEECVTHIFGKHPKNLRKRCKLAETLESAILNYSHKYELTHGGIRSLADETYVEEYSSPRYTGRYSVFLKPEDNIKEILVSDISREIYSVNFHILGVISEAIFQKVGVRPIYLTKDGILEGLLFSLTDRKPDNQKPRQKHELYIGFKYAK